MSTLEPPLFQLPMSSLSAKLIGLVKVSLSQFFLAYNDSSIWKSMVKLDYPVIGMDSYCPIVSPFTTSVHGHLGVLLALGTSTQVCVCVCVGGCACMRVCVRACVCVCIRGCMHMCACVSASKCMCAVKCGCCVR